MSEQRAARAVRVRVTGRVQGVAFRAYAEREGARLGIAGWVSNEPDGSVALHAEGPGEAVEAMLGWCRQGSPAAAVTDVEVEDAEPEGASSFEVRG